MFDMYGTYVYYPGDGMWYVTEGGKRWICPIKHRQSLCERLAAVYNRNLMFNKTVKFKVSIADGNYIAVALDDAGVVC